MQNSTLYPTVYVLGNGQLGRMLRYAGAPLDIHVQPLEFNAPVFDLPKDAIITAEIERWEKTPLTELLVHSLKTLVYTMSVSVPLPLWLKMPKLLQLP